MPITKDPEEQQKKIHEFMYGSTNKEFQQVLEKVKDVEPTPEEIPVEEKQNEEIKQPEKDEITLVSVRVRKSFLKKIDIRIESLEGLTRNAWIVQAIQKQLEFENVK